MIIKNAEIRKKANIYHGGNVTSRTIVTQDGEMKTLGIMLPGTYRFSTEAPETIEVTQGHCRVKLDEKQEWDEYASGDTFNVPANTHFEIEVTDLLDYVCHFQKEA
jgi:uncharacterized protein YaiE (UPF0345 family)